MLYKDFINADKGFQYSINIQYDLNNISKIRGYIPTNASVDILRQYLNSIYYDSKERVTILIGPYGKGKSHLLLILLSILSLPNEIQNEEMINDLCKKIDNIDHKTSKMIYELRHQNRRILPIVINSNYSDLNQAFLIAIKYALERVGLNDIKVDTYFNVIKEKLIMWENDFPETYEIFKEKLKEYKVTIKEFKNRINNYDNESYEIFKEIHPFITSGTIFNPLVNSDIIKIYEEINSKICESYGYSGMFIVFDEFSKFLEASVSRNSSKDIKLIQDFAELANRSGKNQMHLACITHKSINDYISNMPKSKINSWRAIEGRFKQIYFTSSSQQNYELIGNAIIKDEEKFNLFKRKNKNIIKDILDQFDMVTLFNDIQDYDKLIIDRCFPLNPISTYVLPRVSEMVAQNERTLFTFLAKNEKGSLMNFVNSNKGDVEFLSIDWIYDYFDLLFKKEVFNENVHKVWLQSNGALNKTDNITEVKIIKAIAIIYIINELDKLSPTDIILKAALTLRNDNYDAAISSLINKHIIKKKNDGTYKFLLSNEVDIMKRISNINETDINRINVREVLEKIIDLDYELPKKYNDEFQMVRFFKKAFISIDELLAIRFINDINEMYESDGVILNLIYFDEEDKAKAENKLKELNDCRILICIPKEPFPKQKELIQYLSIQKIKSDSNIDGNDMVSEELGIFEEEIKEEIEQYVKLNFNVRNDLCNYYDYTGLLSDIKNNYHINRKISEICHKVFNNTPKINNELINKNSISSQILKARNKIIKYIFEDMENQKEFTVEGNGPEVTIFRTVIRKKGLLDNAESNDTGLNLVLKYIEDFIFSCEERRRNFAELYTILTGPQHGFGLRKGIIPIYLCLKLRDHVGNTVIYFGDKEVPLSVETINRINDNPEKYFILLEKGSIEKNNYINNLENLFSNFKSNKDMGYSRYNTIVEAMQNWIYSLPKYSREYKVCFIHDEINEANPIEEDIINFRKELLKFDVNPREFLFDRIVKKIIKLNTLQDCFERICVIKDQLESIMNNLKKYIINKTKNLFDKGYEGELNTVLKQWYENLPEDNKKHLYSVNSNSFINYVHNLSTSKEEVIIDKLAKNITGLNIEDWNDDTINTYLNEIENIKKEILNYKKEPSIEEDDSYEIAFTVDGNKLIKTFERSEVTPIGNTLFNNVEQIFDDYAKSISDDEKRTIVMKLLQKYM